MIKKLFLEYMISILLIFGLVMLPNPAHAYLVPLVAGAGWLIAVIIGGLAVFVTFIWLHVKKISLMLKNKKNKKEDLVDKDVAVVDKKVDDNVDQD